MTTSATIEAGSWMSVVKMKVTRTTADAAIASTRTAVRAPVSDRTRKCASGHEPKTSRATALPIEAIAFRSKPMARTRPGAAATRSPTDTRLGDPAAQQRRELAVCGELVAEPDGGVEPGVGGPGGGEQGGHAHEQVARVAEGGLGGHGERGAAGGDHLLDGQGAEDTERDGDVDDGGDAEREVHRAGQLTGRFAEVLRGEGDDAEAEEGEEGQGDAGDDVAQRRVAGRARAATGSRLARVTTAKRTRMPRTT